MSQGGKPPVFKETQSLRSVLVLLSRSCAEQSSAWQTERLAQFGSVVRSKEGRYQAHSTNTRICSGVCVFLSSHTLSLTNWFTETCWVLEGIELQSHHHCEESTGPTLRGSLASSVFQQLGGIMPSHTSSFHGGKAYRSQVHTAHRLLFFTSWQDMSFFFLSGHQNEDFAAPSLSNIKKKKNPRPNISSFIREAYLDSVSLVWHLLGDSAGSDAVNLERAWIGASSQFWVHFCHWSSLGAVANSSAPTKSQFLICETSCFYCSGSWSICLWLHQNWIFSVIQFFNDLLGILSSLSTARFLKPIIFYIKTRFGAQR